MEISDSIYLPKIYVSPIDRWTTKLILDKRDLPFIRLTLIILVSVIPFAGLLFYLRDFKWWLGATYLIIIFGYFMGPVILMLHNTSHRALFRSSYRFLRHLIPWGIGPFFGESPETYFSHHVGMHHFESNLSDDLSSTLTYQRDSIFGFLHYLGSFYLTGFPRLLVYLRAKKRKKLFLKSLIGELSFYFFTAILATINFRATLVVFIIPFLVTRFAMMAGNWAQHAFIDDKNPENFYRNSITCINTTYNQRCFNDGYHIGHHLIPSRHWTEMPEDFQQNKNRYLNEGAIVFEGLDYFMIWFYLMLKRYDRLASHFVQLGEPYLTQEETVILLKQRTRAICN